MLKFDRQKLSSRVIAILDLTSGSLNIFTKKLLMLALCQKKFKREGETIGHCFSKQ